MRLNKALRFWFCMCAIFSLGATATCVAWGDRFWEGVVFFALTLLASLGVAWTNAEAVRERDSAELRFLIRKWQGNLEYYQRLAEQQEREARVRVLRPQPTHPGGFTPGRAWGESGMQSGTSGETIVMNAVQEDATQMIRRVK